MLLFYIGYHYPGVWNWFNGVVAVTSASQAEGREFEPRLKLYFFRIYYNRKIYNTRLIHESSLLSVVR